MMIKISDGCSIDAGQITELKINKDINVIRVITKGGIVHYHEPEWGQSIYQAHEYLMEKINSKRYKENTQRLEFVLKKAYKYALGDVSVGTHEITDDLCNALCELIGDKAFQDWCDSL